MREDRAQRASYGAWLEEAGAGTSDVVLHASVPLPGAVGARVCVQEFGEPFPDPPTPDLVLQMPLTCLSLSWIDQGFGRCPAVQGGANMVVVAPDTFLDLRGEGGGRVMTCSLRYGLIRPRLEAASGRDLPHLGGEVHGRVHDDERVALLMHQLQAEAAAGCPGGELASDGLVTALLGQLLRLGGMSRPEPRRTGLSVAQLRNVEDYARAHLGVSISNADLAAEAGVSEFHFIRLFKKATGRTPREHVTRLRVERARGLLRSEPERTLAWVAGRCGFANASHLSRAFKASVGVTPGVFRKGGTG